MGLSAADNRIKRIDLDIRVRSRTDDLLRREEMAARSLLARFVHNENTCLGSHDIANRSVSEKWRADIGRCSCRRAPKRWVRRRLGLWT